MKFINNHPETRLRRVPPLLEKEGSFVKKIEIKYSFKLQTDFNSFPPEASGLREGGHAIGVVGRVYSKNNKGFIS